jgi:uncharacterized protein YidB (DUF937 family)
LHKKSGQIFSLFEFIDKGRYSMGLMDILSEVTGAVSKQKGASQGMLDGILNLLKGGGLSSILGSLKNSGLEDIVQSWISTGQNKPISVEQIKQSLGNEKLQELAASAGIPVEQSSKLLKEMLPDIIDKLSPDGKLPRE